MGPSCEDQAEVNMEDQVALNDGDDEADNEHQAEHDNQGTENPNEQATGETYEAGPSVGNANEYVMHALVGYEPPIDHGIPMSSFERLMINRLDNMVSDKRNHP